jgi:nicotinate-nucleotide pyrophosphorylase (carboxylating)
MTGNELEHFLAEDIGTGDITTDIFVPDGLGKASIVCEQDAVVAGIDEAVGIFRIMGADAQRLVKDGDHVKAGTKVLEINGPLRGMITGERTALNFLMRMSGIATMTDSIVHSVNKKDPGMRIAATRKTTPGFRYYEKKAVALGGGWPHRMGLYDMVMIKDNHILACGGIEQAMEIARKTPPGIQIEVEVTDMQQGLIAAKNGADIIMADHFSPEDTKALRSAVKKIDNDILVEASGNITEANVSEYSGCADIISLGALTHSPKAVHFSMDIETAKN